MKKKLLSMLLLLTLFCTLVPSTLAVSNDNQELFIYSKPCPSEYLDYAKNQVGKFLANPLYTNIGNAEIGTPFTFANQDSNVFYFPIYANGKIELTLRIYSGDDGNLMGVLSPALAADLNEIANLTSRNDPLRIVFHSGDVLFQLNNYNRVVQSIPDNETDETALLAIADNFEVIKCEPTDQILIPPTARKNFYLEVPMTVQPRTQDWCLAYATASVMTYKGVNRSARTIMTQIYGSNVSDKTPLADNDMLSYAKKNGFPNVQRNYHYSYSTFLQKLYTELSSNRPMIAAVRRSGYYWHAVVVCGYQELSGYVIIWNPWYKFPETIASLENYTPTQDTERNYKLDAYYLNW